MFRYGFEVEALYANPETELIDIPPRSWPHDGMPGLVELRTYGHENLTQAYANLLKKTFEGTIDFNRLLFLTEHTFTSEQKRELRKRNIEKTPVEIRNIYNKKPRALGNRTLLSFQINVSNLVRSSYKHENTTIPDSFGLLDIHKIVANLDKEFAGAIASARRQPGEYAIKGDRLEYRSLPNNVFTYNPDGINEFLKKIKKAVEGE